VIGTRVVDTLFEKGEEPVGDAIEINGVWFKVVGVFRTRQMGQQGERDATTIYVPFTTYQQAFNAQNRVDWFAVTAKPGHRASEVETKVLDILRSRHKVAPDDRRGIGFFNLEKEFGKISGLFTGIRALMWIVGLGTLTAGAIGVSNIMLIVVKERTKELGIRRAIGATPIAVVGQIVLEALVLTTVAGLLGLMVGVGLLEGVAQIVAANADPEKPSMFVAPGVSFANALQALGVLVAAGMIAGFIPAQRAVAVPTVVALRAD
jgi:putative ABC transport system permease protein